MLKAVLTALAVGIYLTIVVKSTISPLPILIAALWFTATIYRLFSIFGKGFSSGSTSSVITDNPVHFLSGSTHTGATEPRCGSNGTPILNPASTLRIRAERLFACPECEGQGAFVYQNAKNHGYTGPVKVVCPGYRGKCKMQGCLDWQFTIGAGHGRR